MAYNVTITEVGANVDVSTSAYPVTVTYNAVELDGVGIDTVSINGSSSPTSPSEAGYRVFTAE